VGGVVAEGEVLAVEVHKEECENKEDEERGAGEAYDKAKVGFVGACLFDFHRNLDATQCDHVGGWESNVEVRALTLA
jgi:hypothetical protein